MAEWMNIRFVRCPKCGILLKELPHYSVYKCGGCDAVLRAKPKVTVSDSGEEDVEKLESLSEKEEVNLITASDSDGDMHAKREVGFLNERNSNLVSRTENPGGSVGNSSRYVTCPEEEIGYTEKYRLPMKQKLHRGTADMSISRFQSANSNREKGLGESLAQAKSCGGHLSSRVAMVCPIRGGFVEELHGKSRSTRNDSIDFSTSVTPDEGNGYGRAGNANSEVDAPDGVAHLEQEPRELHRKLNELKKQPTISYTAAEYQRWRTSFHTKVAPSSSETCPGHADYNFQLLVPDRSRAVLPYTKQYGRRPELFTENFGMDVHNLYFPPKYVPSQIPTYKGPQLGRLHSHLQPQCYFQVKYSDSYGEHRASFLHEQLYHHPACSSCYCYNGNQHDPSKISLCVSPKIFSKEPRDSPFKHHIGLRICSPQSNPPSLQSKDEQLHSSCPSDTGPDISGLGQSCTTRAFVPQRKGQYCPSIAGGSPFLTCHSCFELLKLPIRLIARQTYKKKLQCGACSTVHFLEIKEKRLIVSLPSRSKEISAETDDASCMVSNELPLETDDYLYAGVTDVPSENVCYDNDIAAVDSKEKCNIRTKEKFQ